MLCLYKKKEQLLLTYKKICLRKVSIESICASLSTANTMSSISVGDREPVLCATLLIDHLGEQEHIREVTEDSLIDKAKQTPTTQRQNFSMNAPPTLLT